MVTLAILLVFASTSTVHAASAPGTPRNTWQPNGPVNTIVPSADGSKAWIGGDFDYVGPNSGSLVRIDPDTGMNFAGLPRFDGGSVNDIQPDGAGGWFVGGSFTHVGGVARARLVHILPNGTLDGAWGNWGTTSGLNGDVSALGIAGGRLIVGGAFTAYNGVPLAATRHLMAVSTSGTGSLDSSWSDGLNTGAVVHDIEFDGTHVFVGGSFTNYGGPLAHHLLRLDPDTGSDMSGGWLPTIGGGSTVYDVEIAGTRLYLSGDFSAVGVPTRPGLAALVRSTGALDAGFNPGSINDAVKSIAADDDDVYVGGSFTFVDGTNVGNIARFDLNGTLVVGGAPSVQGGVGVRELEFADGNDVVAVGGFTTGAAKHVLRFDRDAAPSALPLAVSTSAPVNAVEVTASALVIGGDFASVGGIARSNLAAIDLSSGEADPGFNAPVPMSRPIHAIVEHGGKLYTGGSGIGKLVQAYGAKTGTAVSTFNTDVPIVASTVPGVVNDLVVYGPSVVAGGSFSDGAGGVDDNFFRVDLNGAVIGSPTLGAVGAVHDLELAGGYLYIAGAFTSLGGVPTVNLLARFNTGGGFLEAGWDPNVNGTVRTISLNPTGSILYAGGDFTSLNGSAPGLGSIAISDTTGQLSGGWTPGTTTFPGTRSIDMNDANADVVIGGSLTQVAGQPRLHVGGAQLSAGPTAWAPVPPRYPVLPVNHVENRSGLIYVAGDGGIAIYGLPSDTTDPSATVSGVEELAGATGEVTHVDAGDPSTVYVRTTGTPPSFKVNVNAHDSYLSGQDTYASMSGLAKVAWPAVDPSRGQWTPNAGAVPGAPRGLVTDCWRATQPGSDLVQDYIGRGIDRSIDYWEATNRPDQLPALPATLAWNAMGSPGYDEQPDVMQPSTWNFSRLACRWNGYLVTPANELSRDYTLRAVADNRIQMNFDGRGSYGGAWPSFPTSMWSSVTLLPGGDAEPVSLGPDQARPISVEWGENAGGGGDAAAVLLWDRPAVAATWEAIPETAFVTNAAYSRTYSFVSGSPIDGGSTQEVVATDRVGLDSSASSTDRFNVVTDNTAPPAASTFTATTTPAIVGDWSRATAIQVTLTGLADDLSSGLRERRLEFRYAPFVVGTGNCGTAGVWTDLTTPPWGDQTGRTHTHAVTNGCWQYRHVAVDNVGNARTQFANLAADDSTWIRIDTTPPTANMSYVSGTTTATTANVDIDDLYDDESGIVTASTLVQRQSIAPVAGACTNWTGADLDPVATGPAVAVGPLALPLVAESCNRYRITATDVAGNTHSTGWLAGILSDDVAPDGDITSVPATPQRTTATIDGTMGDVATGVTAWELQLVGLDDDGDLASDVLTMSDVLPGDCTGMPPTSPPIITEASWSCAIDVTGLRSDTYRVRLVLTDDVGNSSLEDASTFEVDRTAPTIAPRLSPTIGAVYVDPGDDSRAWVNTATSGNITVVPDAADARSGIQSIAMPSMSGFTGWSPLTGPVLTAAPWQSDVSWAGGASTGNPGQLDIIASDLAGNTATGTIELIEDIDAPTGGSITYLDGTGSLATITTTVVSDGGAGIATGDVELQRRDSLRTGPGACAAMPVTWTTIATDPPLSYDDLNTARDRCYEYQLVTTDRVGNQDTWGSSNQFETDGAGIVVSPAGATSLSEAGGSITLNVSLRVAPDADIDVAVDGGGQLDVSASTLQFTTTNWANPQQLVVTATPDDRQELPVTSNEVITFDATSLAPFDGGYDALGTASQTIQLTDDDTANLIIVPPAGGVRVAEPSGSALPATVRLQSEPHGDVDVFIAGNAQVSVTPPSIRFTQANWNIPREVFVTANDDSIIEGAHGTQIQFSTTAPDPGDVGYVGLTPLLSVAIDDDDAPGVTSTMPAGGLQLSEPGTVTRTASYQLTSAPVGTVTVAIGGSPQLQATPSTITFNSTNWSQPRNVSFSAVDDFDVEGTHTASVIHTVSATAADPLYVNLPVPNASATISDDDVASMLVTANAGAELSEADATDTENVQVRLTSRPAADVTVTAGSGGQLATSVPSLTFTAANWNQVQSIAVRAVDDPVAEASPHAGQLQLSAASGDANYAAAASATAAFTIKDDDAAAFTVTPGGNWDLDDEGRLQLVETADTGSVVRIRPVGIPASNVTIEPVASPAEQLEITPKRVTLAAGDAGQVATFTVRAVNDRETEADPHPAKITWKVVTDDVRYSDATIPVTVARIRDSAASPIRETTNPTPTPDPTPNPTSTGNDTTTTQPPSDPVPQPTGDTTVPPPATPTDTGEERATDEKPVVDDGSGSGTNEGATAKEGADEEPAGRTRRVKQWASENKGKAAAAATAGASAALWGAAKPLAMMGKALSSAGGGLPGHTPPGLTQLRRLFKTKKSKQLKDRLWRGARRRRRPGNDDDDDWAEFLWGDDRAA